jgi:hypothetical protein
MWGERIYRAATDGDPTAGVLGPEKVQNLSLRPALARLMVRLPEDHPARVRHPAYFQGLDMAPAAADRLISLLTLALLVGFAWFVRGPARDRGAPALLWECAGVSILMLLLSPITWGQHAVGVLPALYLLSRQVVGRRKLPRGLPMWAGVWVGSVVLLSYEIVGRPNSLLLHGYSIITWNLVALLGMTLACRSRAMGDSAAVTGE